MSCCFPFAVPLPNRQLDNFYKTTEERRSSDENIMSMPKNLQDCYFYYYSVCRKVMPYNRITIISFTTALSQCPSSISCGYGSVYLFFFCLKPHARTLSYHICRAMNDLIFTFLFFNFCLFWCAIWQGASCTYRHEPR